MGLDVLLEIARPDVYRINPFRVLQLPVGATEREIIRRFERMEMVAKLGKVPEYFGGPLPLASSPDLDALHVARNRLADPVARLIHELFWFWPTSENEGFEHPDMVALAHGEIEPAARNWAEVSLVSECGDLAAHNLAILYHTMALDLKDGPGSEESGEDKSKQCESWLILAFRYWKQLLVDERFWRRLALRLRDLGDPRLPQSLVSEIRQALPVAICLIHVRLAARSAERGFQSEAESHLRILRMQKFSAGAIDDSIRRTLKPATDQFAAILEGAKRRMESDPGSADDTSERLVEQTRPGLRIMGSLLLPGNPVLDGAWDEVADCVLDGAILLVNRTAKFKRAVALMETALSIARGKTSRGRLESYQAMFKLCESIDRTSTSNLYRREKLSRLKELARQLPALELKLAGDSPENFAYAANRLAHSAYNISLELRLLASEKETALEALQLAADTCADTEWRTRIQAEIDRLKAGIWVCLESNPPPLQSGGNGASDSVSPFVHVIWVILVVWFLLGGKFCSVSPKPSTISPGWTSPRPEVPAEISPLGVPRPPRPSPLTGMNDIPQIKRPVEITAPTEDQIKQSLGFKSAELSLEAFEQARELEVLIRQDEQALTDYDQAIESDEALLRQMQAAVDGGEDMDLGAQTATMERLERNRSAHDRLVIEQLGRYEECEQLYKDAGMERWISLIPLPHRHQTAASP